MGRLDLRDPPRDEGHEPRKSDVLRGRKITAIELDALAGAARGESQVDTARRTGKSVETVKTQRRFAISKLGGRNMAHAVAIAAAEGLIDVDAIGRSLAVIKMADVSRAIALDHFALAFELLAPTYGSPAAAAFLIASGVPLANLPEPAREVIAALRPAA